jgi:ATP-binding cassette subfamily B protein
MKGNIVFKNVDFIYPHTGIHALKNFNLTIKEGEKIAIVGRTGSGKSTIAQLLLKMYNTTKGQIEIEGVEMGKLNIKNLREQISYVPQDIFLFSDSISSNISFGLPESADTFNVKAAMQASIHDEISGFKHQYDTVLGERGITLSGGQKQRISIARALAKQAGLVIFDDCLSSVDVKTEKEIIGNLHEYLENKTAIIITHRIFSLFEFDKIIVLDEGESVESGTHAELLQKNGYYAELYYRQQEEESTLDSE